MEHIKYLIKKKGKTAGEISILKWLHYADEISLLSVETSENSVAPKGIIKYSLMNFLMPCLTVYEPYVSKEHLQ